MKQYIEKVGHFMSDVGQNVRYQPVTKIPPKERLLRVVLLVEEIKELSDDLGVSLSVHIEPHIKQPDLDPAKMLDHLVDISYVLFGAACSLGLQAYMEPGFDEAHRSNMSKRNPDGSVARDEIGKIIKGPNYSPANFRKVISDQRIKMESGGAFA